MRRYWPSSRTRSRARPCRSIRTVYSQHLLGLDDLGNAHLEALKMGRGLRNLLLTKDPAEQKAAEEYVLEAEAGVHRYVDRARKHLSEDDLALLPSVENAIPRAQNGLRRELPGQSDARRKVVEIAVD